MKYIIFVDQLSIPHETAHVILVDVNFDGTPHQFTINLASSNSPDEVPTNVLAIPVQRMQATQRTPGASRSCAR